MIVVTRKGNSTGNKKKEALKTLSLKGNKVESAGIEPASKQAIKKLSTSLDFV